MSSQIKLGEPARPAASPTGRRRWVPYVVASLLALVAVGLAYAAGLNTGRNSDKPKQELAAARRQIARERATAKSVIERDQAAAHADITREREDAQTAVGKLERQAGDARASLRGQKRKIAAASSQLSKLRSEISGARATIARNTVAGTGTFVVGSDIQPGTYRADARPGCYWARLNSLDTSDIADNDNADGPIVIEVLPTDKALETDGCADFHKVG